MKKPELLAPAGDIEKLKAAVDYGADAVYFGGGDFSLRSAARNFDADEMREGLDYAHSRGRRCYCAVNVLARNDEIDRLGDYIRLLCAEGVDAVIVSDLGVFSVVRSVAPDMDIHISTQASCMNYASADAWYRLGAKRVILSREMTMEEIKRLRRETPDELDIEAFVHGAMCMSHSGRCLLSNYLTGRDSNGGKCAQPCRWRYYLMEEKRPGQYFPVEEDSHGTFILNSRDLCMIEHIPELAGAGITSFKIEGRMKSPYYTACVTSAYRRAIDAYAENPEGYVFDRALYDEVCKVSHREYCTGFYFGDPKGEGQIYATSSYIREWDVVAVVEGYDEKSGMALLSQRNRFFRGDTLELMTFGGSAQFRADELFDGEGEPIDAAPHPEMKLKMRLPAAPEPGMMVRKRRED